MKTEKRTHFVACGRVEGAVFRTSLADGSVTTTFQFSRVYKVGDKWNRSGTFFEEDLERLEEVLRKLKFHATQPEGVHVI